MSFLEKTSWFLANASSSVALMITVFFWFFLYDGENSYANIFVHLLNSIRYLFVRSGIFLPSKRGQVQIFRGISRAWMAGVTF